MEDLNFSKVLLIKDDPLNFIFKLATIPVSSKWIKALYLYVLIIHSLAELTFVYTFFFNFDLIFFITYVPVFCGTLYLIMNLVVYLTFEEKLYDLHGNFKNLCRSLESGGEEIRDKIIKDSFQVKAIFFLYLLLLSVVTLLFLPLYENPEDMFYFLKFVKEHFDSYWIDIVNVLFYMTFPFAAYIFMTIRILNKYLANITTTDKEEVYYNKFYQRRVENKLIFCIILARDIKKFLQIANDIFYLPMILVYILGYLTCACAIFTAYANIENSNSHPRILLIAAVAALTIFTFLTSGQAIIDESNLLSTTLYHSRWYLWNNKNKKLLLFFMGLCNKPMKFSSFGIVTIEYPLGVEMARFLLSLMTFMETIINSANQD